MNINEAMNILGLRPGYTKDDLNKKYKEKMRMWHPDICNDPRADIMAKKINEARELLAEKKNINYQCDDYVERYDPDFENKKNYYINKIHYIFEGIDEFKIYGNTSELIIIDLLGIAAMSISELKNSSNMEVLRNRFYYYIEKINNSIKKYIHEYCEENLMNYTLIKSDEYIINQKYTINLNKRIIEIYRDLLIAKKSRNMFIKAASKVKKFVCEACSDDFY